MAVNNKQILLTASEALYCPTPYQMEVLVSTAKMKVLLNGRQSGKSTVLRMLMYKDAWEEPNRELLYIAKSIKQAKDIMWRSLTKGYDPIFPPAAVREINNVDHYIVLTNGTRITVTGSENVDGLLGKTCHKLYIDEWQSHKDQNHVWTMLQPMVAANEGDVVFAGTARGFDDLWEKCQYGLPNSPTKKAGWRSWHIPTRLSGTPAGRPSAIALAKATLSAQQYAQEYDASPTAAVGRVYSEFDQHENVRERITLNPIVDGIRTEPTLHIGMDFNVGNMAAVVAVKIGDDLHIVDEIHLEQYNSNTPTMAKEIKQRYGNRNIIIYPDASGRNRHSADPSTNHSVLKAAPYNFALRFDQRGNPAIIDRVNTVNSVICNALGERRLFVHPQCKQTLKTLTRQTYKDGKPDKDGGLDHAGDAMGYLIWQLYGNSSGSSFTVGKL